jgi:hypothetical protein
MAKDTAKKKRLKTAKEKRMDGEHLAKMIEANREFLINSACDFADEVQEYEYDVGFISIRTLTMLVDSTARIRGARRRAREKHVYFDPEDNDYDSTWHKTYEEAL